MANLRFPPLPADAMEAVAFDVGYAVLQVQLMERGLKEYIVMGFELEPYCGKEKFDAAARAIRKFTLGQSIKRLAGSLPFDDPLLVRLKKILKHRNWLTHHSRDACTAAMRHQTKYVRLHHLLEAFRTDSLSLQREFASRIEQRVKGCGVPQHELDKEAQRILDDSARLSATQAWPDEEAQQEESPG